MPADAPRPNILWISLEDTSPRFGCYGDPVAHTPNLDRLASEGCRYPNAFSVAGVCAPSRSSIITGMYSTAIGTHQMRTSHSTRPHAMGLATPYEALPPHYVKLIPEYLRAVGYYTTNNVKTDYQFTPPISAWDENSTERTGATASKRISRSFPCSTSPTPTKAACGRPRNASTPPHGNSAPSRTM